jgi:hypothetical protein
MALGGFNGHRGRKRSDGHGRAQHQAVRRGVFVSDLAQSLGFYQPLLRYHITVGDTDAALLTGPNGSQLYLRQAGEGPTRRDGSGPVRRGAQGTRRLRESRHQPRSDVARGPRSRRGGRRHRLPGSRELATPPDPQSHPPGLNTASRTADKNESRLAEPDQRRRLKAAPLAFA